MKIYVAGPMRGKPEFNFPAFDKASIFLRRLGHTVFNPADRDRKVHGADFGVGNTAGSEEQAAIEEGFSIREALAADAKWICEEADAIWMLEDWETSLGARAEHALATALHLRIFYDCDLPIDEPETSIDDTVLPSIAELAPAGRA